MALPTKNYVHEDEIWRQQLKNETDVAADWKANWGFLSEREHADVRGFSTSVAKYSTTGGKWSVKTVRVADDSEAGRLAAESEQNARKTMSSLRHDTAPTMPVKACEHKGAALVRDSYSGVEDRTAAMSLRAHNFQCLGDAGRTRGVDPVAKYHAPVVDSHECASAPIALPRTPRHAAPPHAPRWRGPQPPMPPVRSSHARSAHTPAINAGTAGVFPARATTGRLSRCSAWRSTRASRSQRRCTTWFREDVSRAACRRRGQPRDRACAHRQREHCTNCGASISDMSRHS